MRRYTSGLHYFLLSTFRQSIVTLNWLEKNIYFDTREEDKVPGYTHTSTSCSFQRESSHLWRRERTRRRLVILENHSIFGSVCISWRTRRFWKWECNCNSECVWAYNHDLLRAFWKPHPFLTGSLKSCKSWVWSVSKIKIHIGHT